MSLTKNPPTTPPARLFLALPVTGDAARALTRALEEFRLLLPGVKWEAPEALHLTLKFIGACDDAEPLIAALAAHPWPTLTLSLQGLDAFPDRRRPRILWAGAEPALALTQWARLIEQTLAPLGFAADARPFIPHVSLARIGDAHAAAALRRRLDPRQPVWGRSPAHALVLYQTLAGVPASQRYRPLHRFPTG